MPPYMPDHKPKDLTRCSEKTETKNTSNGPLPKKVEEDLKPFIGKINELTTFKTPLIWPNIIAISLYHVFAFVGLLMYSSQGNWKTTSFAFVMGIIGGFGVTGGAHRLWCHRAYKANLPLRIILMLCYAVAGQNTLYDWVRDHRVHHKYTETDADPHNSNRGFFFAHVGWLMMKKHPEVIKKGRLVDMSDITEDPVIQFHLKYFKPLKIMFCFVLPTVVPVYFWNESWMCAIISQPLVRYVFNLNFTWLVNSLAHISGNKPYDKRISPVENVAVAIVAMGEGWHNYHHAFPWDYKAAELGNYSLNFTTMFLDFFAKIGWAYDLRQPSPRMIKKLAMAHGDGSHPHFHQEIPEEEDDDHEETEVSQDKSE